MRINITFVCIGNTCRSQIAEGFANNLLINSNSAAEKKIRIYSAGTYPAYEVNPNAVEVMREKGIDISGQYPKAIDEVPQDIDILITMGCGVECPYLPSKHREDWQIEDPIGMPLDFFRKIRDIIEKKVENLINLVKESKSLDEIIESLEIKKQKA